jgi:hypothetical protein
MDARSLSDRIAFLAFFQFRDVFQLRIDVFQLLMAPSLGV